MGYTGKLLIGFCAFLTVMLAILTYFGDIKNIF